MIRYCKRCGQPFTVRQNRASHVYCSHRCSHNVGVPVEERFWSKVLKGDGCWEWQGSKTKGGYGQFSYPGRLDKDGAHRIAWQLACGPIPEGMWVLHNCPGGDNRACCNPAHLWLGTRADNDSDKMEKGRHRFGNVKLTVAQVQEIRVRAQRGARTGPGNTAHLAREFGVSKSHISWIIRGDGWKMI